MQIIMILREVLDYHISMKRPQIHLDMTAEYISEGKIVVALCDKTASSMPMGFVSIIMWSVVFRWEMTHDTSFVLCMEFV